MDARTAPGDSHSSEVLEVHERMLAASGARSSQLETRSAGRVHVVETGAGPPVLFLHGSGTSSLSLLPLLEHLRGVRAIAVDRPGFGLSEPAPVPRSRFRDAAVAFVDEVVDQLGLDEPVVAGQSMGGTWALWYALARPDRVGGLALVGSAPLLPGTRPPLPLRLMATPVLGDVLARVGETGPQGGRPVDVVDGRAAHHRALPGPDRRARRRRQRPGRHGHEPGRAPSGDLAVRVPARASVARRRAPAADRTDAGDLGRPGPGRHDRGRRDDGSPCSRTPGSRCCPAGTSRTWATPNESAELLSEFALVAPPGQF